MPTWIADPQQKLQGKEDVASPTVEIVAPLQGCCFPPKWSIGYSGAVCVLFLDGPNECTIISWPWDSGEDIDIFIFNLDISGENIITRNSCSKMRRWFRQGQVQFQCGPRGKRWPGILNVDPFLGPLLLGQVPDWTGFHYMFLFGRASSSPWTVKTADFFWRIYGMSYDELHVCHPSQAWKVDLVLVSAILGIYLIVEGLSAELILLGLNCIYGILGIITMKQAL